jgi:hypothetical protein
MTGHEFTGWRDGSASSERPITEDMTVAVSRTAMRPHASNLLLRHCLALGSPGSGRVPARVRLDEALGPELARKLVASLTAASRR